jgi:hypothetical protein
MAMVFSLRFSQRARVFRFRWCAIDLVFEALDGLIETAALALLATPQIFRR